jgi:hypothetical protein
MASFSKPWSTHVFESERKHMTDWINLNVIPLINSDDCLRILIRAPVKSGKREIVEYISVKDLSNDNDPVRVHVFITAFHRVADEQQRKELKDHNMEVFSLKSDSVVDQCKKYIIEQLRSGKKVVLHIDECDFGSGEHQLLSKIYETFNNEPDITFILYSATPQEVLFSGEVNEEKIENWETNLHDFIEEGVWLEYTPPDTFCGPGKFLDENLVFEATRFFQKNGNIFELTDQGREIINGCWDSIESHSQRNIIVLRLSYTDLGKGRSKNNKAIYQFLDSWTNIEALRGCAVYVDKEQESMPSYKDVTKLKITWSNKNFWRTLSKEIPIIIVLDQTSSRSTEWEFHDRIFAQHDYRNNITFSVVSQAQERVNHYSQKYGEFQPIYIYGSLDTFLLSAGRIDYDTYLNIKWKKKKINKSSTRSLGNGNWYNIVNEENILHPEYNLPIPEEDIDSILERIGCFSKMSLSTRVKGKICKVPIYKSKFYRCNKESFFKLKEKDPDIFNGRENPFVISEKQGLENGKWKGYIREWKVFDYYIDIKPKPGWGLKNMSTRITICYKKDVLGVAYRYPTGEHKEMNTLSAYKSMYE